MKLNNRLLLQLFIAFAIGVMRSTSTCTPKTSLSAVTLCNSGAYFPNTPIYEAVQSGTVKLWKVPLLIIYFFSKFGNVNDFSREDATRYVEVANEVFHGAGLQFELTYLRFPTPVASPFCARNFFTCTEDTADEYWSAFNSIVGSNWRDFAVRVLVTDAVSGYHPLYATLPFVGSSRLRKDRTLGALYMPSNSLSASTRDILFVHELGHAFGLLHTFTCDECRLSDAASDGLDDVMRWRVGDLVGDTGLAPKNALYGSYSAVGEDCSDYYHRAKDHCDASGDNVLFSAYQPENAMGYDCSFCRSEAGQRLTVGQKARARCFAEYAFKPTVRIGDAATSLGADRLSFVEVSLPYAWVIGGTYEARVDASLRIVNVYLMPGSVFLAASASAFELECERLDESRVKFQVLHSMSHRAFDKGVYTVFVRVAETDEVLRSDRVTLIAPLCVSDRESGAWGVCRTRSECLALGDRAFSILTEECQYAGSSDFGCCTPQLRDVSAGVYAFGTIGDVADDGSVDVDDGVAGDVEKGEANEGPGPQISVSGSLMSGEVVRVSVRVAQPTSWKGEAWLWLNTQKVESVAVVVGAKSYAVPIASLPKAVEAAEETFVGDVELPFSEYEDNSYILVSGLFYVGAWGGQQEVHSRLFTLNLPPCRHTTMLNGLSTSGLCVPKSVSCPGDRYRVGGLCAHANQDCCVADERAYKGAYRLDADKDETPARTDAGMVTLALSVTGAILFFLLALCLCAICFSRRRRHRHGEHALVVSARRPAEMRSRAETSRSRRSRAATFTGRTAMNNSRGRKYSGHNPGAAFV